MFIKNEKKVHALMKLNTLNYIGRHCLFFFNTFFPKYLFEKELFVPKFKFKKNCLGPILTDLVIYYFKSFLFNDLEKLDLKKLNQNFLKIDLKLILIVIYF